MTKFLSKTTSRIILSIVILVAFIGTAVLFEFSPSSDQNESNGPVDECGPYEPTDEDVKRTLTLGNGIFDSPDWEKRYSVEPYKVTVIRQNDVDTILALAENLIFTCGYGQNELNNLFGGDNLNSLFSDYNTLVVSNFCEKPNDIALYELDLTLDGVDYISRLWVKQESDTRLLTMRLVFLKADSAKLDEYSKKVFPEYSSCK
jgi:hypothetical protein